MMDPIDYQQSLRRLFAIYIDRSSDIELLLESLPLFQYQRWRADQSLFNQGEQVDTVYFLLSGVGRYFYLLENGLERNKSLVRFGGAFASVSTLVQGVPSPFSCQTITPCTTAAIRYVDLVNLAEAQPVWSTFVRRLYEQLAIKKEKREAALLTMTARQRYEAFLQDFADEAEQIPLRQVAMFIGITDVALSRIRREMGLT
jgi:CRP-like cAMP-binding protein